MPTRVRSRASQAFTPLIVKDFSGGLNLRDAPSEMAPNESPDCLNITLDERGGVVKRLGLSSVTAQTLTNAAQHMFFWRSKQQMVLQDGAALKTTGDFSSYTTVHTFSTADRVGMCEFKTLLIVVHPVDGVSSWDGSSWNSFAVSPKGRTIVPWQNKVWVAGDPTAGQGDYVWYSAPGDETSWPVDNYVAIREVDSERIMALGQGQGFDPAVAAPSLLVYKRHSVYRIYDSTSGAYQTLHTTAGASGPMAIGTVMGRTASLNDKGFWLTDGTSPPIYVSARLEPIFHSDQINFSQQDKWCVGRHGDRLLFSITWGSGQTTNNRSFEFHPEQGWFVPHSFGVSSMAEWEKDTRQLYGAQPTGGKIYELFTGGSDDGTAIASRYQTPWFEPADGFKMRLRRMLVEGRGQFSLYVKGDYTLGEGTLCPVEIGGAGGTWGSGVWGGVYWGANYYESFQSFFSLGVVRAVSFVMRESSTETATGPPVLGDGYGPEVGAFACYGLHTDFIQLGVA